MERVAKEAAILATVEIGLGSFLHGFKVPLGGHFLSLNQVFLLSYGVKKDPTGSRVAPFQISSIAAVLKSLSPVGKKLTPMLAIAMQGLLFSTGTFFAGTNLIGCLIGGVLASSWAFAQPLLLYYLFYGDTLLSMGQFYFQELNRHFTVSPDHLLVVALSLVFCKALLGGLSVGLAYFLPQKKIETYQSNVIVLSNHRGKWKAGPEGIWENLRLAARDLTQPMFLLSLWFTLLFLLFSESSSSQIVWQMLRPVAVAFIIFFLVRMLPLEKIAAIRRTLTILRNGPGGMR